MNSPEILGDPAFQLAALAQDAKSGLRAQIVDALLSTKTWGDMTKKERDLCVHHLASESESEADLRSRLAEIGVGYFAVEWKDIDPHNKTSLEIQMIVKALGGPIAKNGALVMVSTIDDL